MSYLGDYAWDYFGDYYGELETVEVVDGSRDVFVSPIFKRRAIEMTFAPGENFSISFATYVQQTLADVADLPTAVMRRNGSDTAEEVTITPMGGGEYVASGTVPTNWSIGDCVEAVVSASDDDLTGQLILVLGPLRTFAQGSGDASAAAQNQILQAVAKLPVIQGALVQSAGACTIGEVIQQPIIQGDDYQDGSLHGPIRIDIDPDKCDLTSATVVASSQKLSGADNNTIQHAAEVVDPGLSTQAVLVTLTAEQTRQMGAGYINAPVRHRIDIQATKSTYKTTVYLGTFNCVSDLSA